MSFLVPYDSLRLAAALLVRASAGSALTALMLLVLVGTSSCGNGWADPAAQQQTATDGSDLGVDVRHEDGARCATGPVAAPRRAPVATRPCALVLRSVVDATLPPTRAP